MTGKRISRRSLSTSVVERDKVGGALTVPLNLAALAAIPGTNLVATLNKRLVDRYSDDPALAVVAAPAQIGPFQYVMVWHPRLDNDAAQQWLRSTIRSVAHAVVAGTVGRR